MSFKLSKSNLNFKTYTVPSKPTTPGAENDIAVISSVPMTNWIMSPEEPTGIPRNDGDVWIQYSVEGDLLFNTLKQNALMITAISARQYVDGAWVDREAVTCQGGVWNELAMYLYRNGNEYESLTGGWTEFTVSGWGSNGILLSKDATGLVLKKDKSVTGGQWPARGYATKNVIDLSSVKAISILVETAVNKYSSASKFRIGVTDSLDNKPESWKAINAIQLTTSGTFTYDLDVASVEGGFICVTQFDEAAANDITVTVKEVRLK